MASNPHKRRITDSNNPLLLAPGTTEVLKALKSPLAVFGENGRVIFNNASFAALFSAPKQIPAVASWLMSSDFAASYQLRADDGRFFVLEASRLSEGILVSAEAVAEAGDAVLRDGDQVGDRQMFRHRLNALLENPGPAIDSIAVLMINVDRLRPSVISLDRPPATSL